jgi:hypothetical protein
MNILDCVVVNFNASVGILTDGCFSVDQRDLSLSTVYEILRVSSHSGWREATEN